MMAQHVNLAKDSMEILNRFPKEVERALEEAATSQPGGFFPEFLRRF